MANHGSNPRRVLIAEALDDSRSRFAAILRDAGYTIVEASSAQQAVQTIRAGAVEVAIIDAELPDRNGLDIVRELRSAKVPLILCSFSWNLQHGIQAVKQGAFDCLNKRCDRWDLIEMVNAAVASLEGQTSEMENRESGERQRLSQRMEVFGRLATGIIHDFNNLLTVILGYADISKPHIEEALGHVEFLKKTLAMFEPSAAVVDHNATPVFHPTPGSNETEVCRVVYAPKPHMAEMPNCFPRVAGLPESVQVAGAELTRIANALRSFAEEITNTAHRGKELTTQLLAFSRDQPLETREIDLNEIVHGTKDLLGRLLNDHIHVIPMLGSSLGKIRADRGQIEQVLTNLIINARDAMPQGGTIWIQTSQRDLVLPHNNVPPGSYVTLSIRDTGSGMSPEVRARVFEPFYTTKSPGSGTGLGLHVVAGIVEKFGGHIHLRSELGKGTSFTLYFPRLDNNKSPASGTMSNSGAFDDTIKI